MTMLGGFLRMFTGGWMVGWIDGWIVLFEASRIQDLKPAESTVCFVPFKQHVSSRCLRHASDMRRDLRNVCIALEMKIITWSGSLSCLPFVVCSKKVLAEIQSWNNKHICTNVIHTGYFACLSVFSCSSSQRSVLSLCVDAPLWAHGSEDDVVSSGVPHHGPPPGEARELGLAFTSGQAGR